MEQELSLLIVFAAGLLSFLSPCVLPLIPGYIAFVSGLSVNDMTERRRKDKKMASAILSSVMFVLGFSAVFVALICAVYVTLGGQTSVIMTDLAQGIILLIAGILEIGAHATFFKPKIPIDKKKPDQQTISKNEQTPSEKESKTNFCSECGAKMEEGTMFCPECGTKPD